MNTNKLVEKLEDFFDLSKKKQRKKHNKLLKIIRKLKKRESTLEEKVHKEKKISTSSKRYQDLNRELLVVSRLISKAQQKDLSS